MQISPIKNQTFEKPCRNLSNWTKVEILEKKILDIFKKKIGSAYMYAQSPRNVRTSKFWRKSKEKKRLFFENL
jgi:hypothetical protein